jgi:hypothetical protein
MFAVRSEQSEAAFAKKRAGPKPRSKIVSTLFSPKNLDLILIDGVTLLVRAGLLPRLGPPDFNLAASLSPHW